MSAEPETTWTRTASADHSFPWALSNHEPTAAAYSASQDQQVTNQQYSSTTNSFTPFHSHTVQNNEPSQPYAPQLPHGLESQLAQLRAAYPGFTDDQLLGAIYPSLAPSSYSHLSQSLAPPNVYSNYGSTLDSALTFSPSANAPLDAATGSRSAASPVITIEDEPSPPIKTDHAAPAPTTKARASPPVKSAPRAPKKAKASSPEEGLWSKLKPHLSRLRLERDPTASAREMIGLLSETDSDGRFRKPVATEPELREAIVQSLASIAVLEMGKGFSENGRRKFFGAWIASPAGRQLLANWLRQTVRPKTINEGAPDLSKLYKSTLLPLLAILDQVPMQVSYLQDAAGPAKVLTGVINRASDPTAQKLASRLKAKWTEVYDKAGPTTTASAGSPVTTSAAPVSKRKAAEAVSETTKRYKSVAAASTTKAAAASTKPGLSFFASATAKPAVPAKKPAPARTLAKTSAHQSIQALMNTVIPGDQKEAGPQATTAANLTKSKDGSAKKVKRVSWRDESDLVAVRWIESRDAEQEKQEGHVDFEHEGDALKRAVSSMEEQITWYSPCPLNLADGLPLLAKDSVEGPFQTQRNSRLQAVSYSPGEEPATADESQVNNDALTSPAPAELLQETRDIFLPSTFLPADNDEMEDDVPVSVGESGPDRTTSEEAASTPVTVVAAGPAPIPPPEPAPIPPTMSVTPPGPAPVPPPTMVSSVPGLGSAAPDAATPPPTINSDIAALLAKVKGVGAKLAEDGKNGAAPAAQLDMDLLQSILQNVKPAGGNSVGAGAGMSASANGPPPPANISSLLANLSSNMQQNGHYAAMGGSGNYWQHQQAYSQPPSTTPISSYPGEYNEDYTTQQQAQPFVSAVPAQPFHQQQHFEQQQFGQQQWDHTNTSNGMSAAYIQSKLHTKPCKFFASGKCWRGDNCNFLHG